MSLGLYPLISLPGRFCAHAFCFPRVRSCKDARIHPDNLHTTGLRRSSDVRMYSQPPRAWPHRHPESPPHNCTPQACAGQVDAGQCGIGVLTLPAKVHGHAEEAPLQEVRAHLLSPVHTAHTRHPARQPKASAGVRALLP